MRWAMWRSLWLVLTLLAGVAVARDTAVTACSSLTEWIAGAGTFPQPGTTFCPTDKAFDDFAKDTGYRDWDQMWGVMQANPDAWRPFARRVMSYSSLAAEMPSSAFPDKDSDYTTRLAAGRGARSGGGGAGSGGTFYETLRVDAKVKSKGTNLRIRASARGTGRAKVVVEDMIQQQGAVVHAVDSVVMPSNTYHNLKKAFKKTKGLKHTYRSMKKHMKSMLKDPTTWTTIFAPTDDAWKGLKFPKPTPAWAGNITYKAVKKNKGLERSLMQYAYVQLPQEDVKEVLTWDNMLDAWKLTAGPNYVGVRTILTAAGQQQITNYLYDGSSDSIYLVGGRNFVAEPYMAGGAVSKDVIYAGASTILTISSFPLPEGTGVFKYDQLYLP